MQDLYQRGGLFGLPTPWRQLAGMLVAVLLLITPGLMHGPMEIGLVTIIAAAVGGTAALLWRVTGRSQRQGYGLGAVPYAWVLAIGLGGALLLRVLVATFLGRAVVDGYTGFGAGCVVVSAFAFPRWTKASSLQ